MSEKEIDRTWLKSYKIEGKWFRLYLVETVEKIKVVPFEKKKIGELLGDKSHE